MPLVAVAAPRVDDCVLLIIDMLNDFAGEFEAQPEHREKFAKCANNIRALANCCREHGVPVIYVCCSHKDTASSPEFRFAPSHGIAGTPGARVIDALAPTETDLVIGKNTYSGFYGTELEATLNGLKRSTIVLTGVHSHVCIQATALDAFYRGFRVVVPRECVTTKSPPRHAHALRFVSGHVGDVVHVRDLLSLLRSPEEGA